MSEGLKIVFTTVVSGTAVFALGQLMLKFIIEPIQALWRLRGEIADSLIFYANVYMNVGYGPKDSADEASKLFRQQACQLMARAHLIPLYGLWEHIGLVHRRQILEGAYKELIGLSSSTYAPNATTAGATDHMIETNRIRRVKIVKLLNLKIDA